MRCIACSKKFQDGDMLIPVYDWVKRESDTDEGHVDKSNPQFIHHWHISVGGL